jgi:glycosyltransferase involved in cell wall biosynthesis
MHEISNSNIHKLPLVSVLMITYNHADYLAQAIESVVSQKCDFPFELIIGEDASKDATLEVALNYQNKYPDIIRIIYSESNVGMNMNSKRIFDAARGKYIAYCEGDDYWCSSDKLKEQVDLMENDEDIGIVHSDWTKANLVDNCWIVDENKSAHHNIHFKYLRGHIFETWFYPKILRTCTILLKRNSVAEWYNSGIMNPEYHFGDSVLAAWITQRSKVGYIAKTMAVYRVSPNSALRSGNKARVALYESALNFDTDARIFFENKKIYNYPFGYRWETAISLLLWSLKSLDFSTAKKSLTDITKHFTIRSFVATGYKNIIMRLKK